MKTLPCQHCGQRKIARPRRLCAPCFYDLAVRSLYPARKSHGPALVQPQPVYTAAPAEPTPHPPGSAEKVAVLAERYTQGKDLWHEADGQWQTGCVQPPHTPKREPVTPDVVALVRRLWALGMRRRPLAEKFGLSDSTIHDITSGRTHRQREVVG